MTRSAGRCRLKRGLGAGAEQGPTSAIENKPLRMRFIVLTSDRIG